jgi:phosphatidylethanolamine-binding protein (PEBP) family uncharacterized protein
MPGAAGTGPTPGGGGTGVAGSMGGGDASGAPMGGGMGGDSAAGAGMGGDASLAGAGMGGSTGGMSGGGDFVFTSAEFMDGDELPDAHTCATGDFQGAPSPSFTWSGAPEGTQSFAMVMIDKTLVDMGDTLGYHSAFWNLPARVTSVPVDLATSADIMAAEVITRGYLGPCPTLGNVPVPHTYTFTLYALPEASVSLPGQLDAQFIETLEGMALESKVLTCESSASLN